MPLAYLCPGCSKLRDKPGRCAACMRPANRVKNQRTNARGVYQKQRWKNLRDWALFTRDGEVCAVDGCTRRATTVDHIEPFDGPTDPLAFDPHNVQSLCAVHHGQKDATRRYA